MLAGLGGLGCCVCLLLGKLKLSLSLVVVVVGVIDRVGVGRLGGCIQAGSLVLHGAGSLVVQCLVHVRHVLGHGGLVRDRQALVSLLEFFHALDN